MWAVEVVCARSGVVHTHRLPLQPWCGDVPPFLAPSCVEVAWQAKRARWDGANPVQGVGASCLATSAAS